MNMKTVHLYLVFEFKRSMSHYQRNSRAKLIFKGWFIKQPIHAQSLAVSNAEIYNLRSHLHLFMMTRYIRRLLFVFAMKNTIKVKKVLEVNKRCLNQNSRTMLMTKKIFVPSIRPLECVSVVRTDVLPGPGGIMSLQVIFVGFISNR